MANGKLTGAKKPFRCCRAPTPPGARVVVHIVKARPSWAKQTVGLLRRWLDEGTANAGRRELLRGMLSAFGTEKDVQELITQALYAEKTSPSLRLLLLETIAQLPLDHLPPGWKAELGRCLDLDNERPLFDKPLLAFTLARSLLSRNRCSNSRARFMLA